MSLTNVSEYRTAESVSPRHPDKICDQVSDAILDAYLREDATARVAIDVAGGHGILFITGEVTSTAHSIDIEAIARRVSGKSIETVIIQIAEQSGEIANGVDAGGAGDQGIMIGYATNETPELLPLEVVLARQLNLYLYERWPYDGKTQVTLRNGHIESVVASFQNASRQELQDAVTDWLQQQQYVQQGSEEIREPVRLHVNPAGDWQQGGFDSDAGLTGRKLAVDNYGPRVAIGGGAFSGKDASKVDRSAAYMARRIAVDYLRARKASEVTVRLAYAIGYDQPLEASMIIDGHYEKVQGYDLTPHGIITALDLQRPQYEQTAKYGHFGHGFGWEV